LIRISGKDQPADPPPQERKVQAEEMLELGKVAVRCGRD